MLTQVGGRDAHISPSVFDNTQAGAGAPTTSWQDCRSAGLAALAGALLRPRPKCLGRQSWVAALAEALLRPRPKCPHR